jgi:rhamnosyltransferase
MANGEFVLFLTHDAVPADDQWLESMLSPFSISERVACVYGKQIPWPHCCPTVKRDVIESFRRFGPEHAISVQGNTGPGEQAVHDVTSDFFSDVNSAIRRSVLLKAVPFRDLPYAEDQAFGRDVLDSGFLKVYTPYGAVFHSNDHSMLAYYRRIYDEVSGLNQATGRTRTATLARDIAWTGKSTLQDWRFTMRDGDYSHAEKLRWLVEAPLYNLARGVAVRLAARDHIPPWVSRFSSLESNLRRAA